MSDRVDPSVERKDVLKMASDVVAAYVARNPLPADQVPGVISSVFQSLQSLSAEGVETPQEPPKPAVSIRSSVKPDHIVCLEDGKKLKMLKRHLRTDHDMTPEEYRAKWGLPRDYPIVAPDYAERRSAFAKKIGLGRKAGESAKRGSRKKA
jgi:predicted transcriptional regulator